MQNTSRPKILILGAGRFYVDTIMKIKSAGFEVHAVDRNVDAPGKQESHFFKNIDIKNIDGIIEYVNDNQINGIMPLNDFGTRTAFYVSQKLNLINPCYLSGICGNDKGLMRDVWAHEKLLQPKYKVISKNISSLKFIEEMGFPLVVKPTDCGGGGRGVTIANDIETLYDAISIASEFAENDRVIVEEFIEGVEVTVDSIAFQGEVYPLAVSDKEKPETKYRVATSLNYPADFPEEIIKKIKHIAIKASEALGIANGATHIELIVTPQQKIHLVEIGTRGGGGHVFSTIIEAVTGISAPIQLAKILCGLKPDLTLKKNKGCVYRFFNPKDTGVIRNIEFDKSFIGDPDVLDFGITARIGDEFRGLVNSLERVGYVVTSGSSREDAINKANQVEGSVHFTIE